MKTEPQRPLPPVRDDVLLAEEVLIIRPSRTAVRTLLVPALLAVTQCVHRKEPFELRRLNDDVLCAFDGDKYNGRVEILTVMWPVLDYMDQYSKKLGAAVAEELAPMLRAEIRKELKAGSLEANETPSTEPVTA